MRILPLLVIICTVFGSLVVDARNKRPRAPRSRLLPMMRHMERGRPNRFKTRPNIVVFITDDQDVMLNSMAYMPKTQRILAQGGAVFNNSFVTTPMCCPSRSSILTGRYVHNHNVFTNNENCSSPYWQRTHEPYTFATYLSNAGYRTGYFGKYLNEYNGSYVPPGWREWVGQIRNSRFYNYKVNRNGLKFKHGFSYERDYFTDLIANDSASFFKLSKKTFPHRPVAMVLAFPAPHGPEDGAPQYSHMFENNTDHRIQGYNMAPNMDKHWILRWTQQLSDKQLAFTDMLQQKRLQTLQSVDDAVEKVYNMLIEQGQLENTYMIYTSDHGYHLGQFGLVKGKSFPYDWDTRVPYLIRGPSVQPNTVMSQIVLNIDLAPTLLDIAGVDAPPQMDGNSIMPLFENASDINNKAGNKKKKQWRDTFLLERGKIPKKMDRTILRINEKLPKEVLLSIECQKEDYQSPCKPGQAWECIERGGMLRMKKCKFKKRPGRHCVCRKKVPTVPRDERRSQRNFLKDHATQDFRFRFIRSAEVTEEAASENPGYKSILKRAVSPGKEWRDPFSFPQGDQSFPKCFLFPNNTVKCDNVIYESYDAWKQQKQSLDAQIARLKGKLDGLKDIRGHLRKTKPLDGEEGEVEETFIPIFPAVGDYEEEEEDDDEEEEEEEDCVCAEDEEVVYVDGDGVEQDRPFYSSGRRRYAAPRDRERRSRERARDRTGLRGSDRRQKLTRPPNPHPQGEHPMKAIREGIKSIKVTPEEREERQKKKERKQMRRLKMGNCNLEGLNCFEHDNDHWTVPPYWTKGSFCSCINSNNNTYWCLRTINSTHNFMYCEFITGFVEYFDLLEDPFMLHNNIHRVSEPMLAQLHDQLVILRRCEGAKECTPKPQNSNMRNRHQEPSGEGGEDKGSDVKGESSKGSRHHSFQDGNDSTEGSGSRFHGNHPKEYAELGSGFL
ncbi:extracellular sulfatase Sulf-1-like isoform X2 [Branchiostoma lanceolatum]|uniref:extracellular sulfatase Sulf-1-like isoform X2 n=1 Tax=Branchiostoma lanceolatum TaxID=7740 RepID=UPI003453B2A5